MPDNKQFETPQNKKPTLPPDTKQMPLDKKPQPKPSEPPTAKSPNVPNTPKYPIKPPEKTPPKTSKPEEPQLSSVGAIKSRFAKKTKVPPKEFKEPPTTPTKARKPLIGGLLVVVLLILVFGTLSVSALISYGKIPIKNKVVRDKISGIFFKIPFLPKTPEYILKKSIETHSKLSGSKFDISLATEAGSLSSIVGTNSLDFSMKGKTDLSDVDNMRTESNIKVSGFDVDFKVIKKDLYFNIHDISTTIIVLMGYEDSNALDSLMDTWVHYEIPDYDTRAREQLDETKKSLFDETYEKLMGDVYYEKVVKKMKVTNEVYNGEKVFKLTSELNNESLTEIVELLEALGSEQSGILGIMAANSVTNSPFDSITTDLYITRDKYYMVQADVHIVTSSDLGSLFYGYGSGYMLPEIPDVGLDQPKAELVISIGLSGFDEDLDIVAPTEAISSDEFLLKFLSIGDTSPPLSDSDSDLFDLDNLDITDLENLQDLEDAATDPNSPFSDFVE